MAALCGRRQIVREQVQAWVDRHPALAVQVLDYQGPDAMADLYRRAWAMVSRPGARTATEALFMGCPLVFNHYGTTMPQELIAPGIFMPEN